MYNTHGTFHDSSMENYKVYATIKLIYKRTEGKVVVDSVFRQSKNDYIIMSSQLDPMETKVIYVSVGMILCIPINYKLPLIRPHWGEGGGGCFPLSRVWRSTHLDCSLIYYCGLAMLMLGSVS